MVSPTKTNSLAFRSARQRAASPVLLHELGRGGQFLLRRRRWNASANARFNLRGGGAADVLLDRDAEVPRLLETNGLFSRSAPGAG